MAESSAAEDTIKGDNDNFNGVVIKPSHYGQTSPGDFRQKLSVSLKAWKAAGKRGVWLMVPLTQSDLIPVAAELGFEFHHTKPDLVTMTCWLPDEEASTLPIFATHNIGVAGFVVNDKNEVLVIQEKWLRRINIAHWKLPGGVCDPGEDLWKTAIRETYEETGIKTEFISVLSFRHMHGYTWGIDDLYFACLLRPLNTDVKANPSEVSAAKWMDVDEYIADPNTFHNNRLIAQAYKEAVKNGSSLQPLVQPHFLRNKPDTSFYRIVPIDPTQSCDLTCKEYELSPDLKEKLDKVTSPSVDKPKSNI